MRMEGLALKGEVDGILGGVGEDMGMEGAREEGRC